MSLSSMHIALRTAFMVAALIVVAAASAAEVAAEFRRGPMPTAASLEATKGPFTVASAKVAAPNGYGAGTVYYPTTQGQGSYGLIMLSPGFLAVQNYYAWLAERVASHGFVVVNLNMRTIVDSPDKRGPQMLAALTQIVALSKTASVPYAGLVDDQRVALMGHSAGGGGALLAALGDTKLKAVVAMTPASNSKDFSKVMAPTLVLAAQNDTIAPNKTYSIPLYQSFDPAITSAYMEMAGLNHLSPTFLANAKSQATVGKYVIAWVKRHVDGDMRYTPFINAPNPELSRFEARGVF